MKKYLKFIAASLLLASCSGSKSQDPFTGNPTQPTCQNPFGNTDTYRGELTLSKDADYINVNTSISDGTKRIIRLYNEANCVSRLDTDYFGKTDTYVVHSSNNSTFLGLSVVTGSNKIDFVVDECEDIIVSDNYRCVNRRNTDSGYLILNVN